MVRTKASNAAPAAARKAVAARAPRKTVSVPRPALSPSSPGGGKSRKGKAAVGGNPAKLWPTPEWQKGIGSFLKGGGRLVEDQEEPGPSREPNHHQEEAGPSREPNHHHQEEEEEMEEEVPSGSGCSSSGGVGVALLDSSIAQLNSDDEDSN